MRLVLTHSKPDADAIAAAWLAATHLFTGEHVEVAFVARPRHGWRAPGADCLVEVISESWSGCKRVMMADAVLRPLPVSADPGSPGIPPGCPVPHTTPSVMAGKSHALSYGRRR